jgi:hypothetical protein
MQPMGRAHRCSCQEILFLAAVLTEIYLCHACSCQEILFLAAVLTEIYLCHACSYHSPPAPPVRL